MKLDDAREIARKVMARLSPYSDRLDIAGSVRRQKDDVGDIEIVAVPKLMPILDMFGAKTGDHSMLNDRKLMESLGIVRLSGKRYTKIELYQGINLDLFMVLPPADWAVIMAIRTGPADFSKWIVTPRSKGGALPNGLRVEDGRVWDGTVEVRFGYDEGKFMDFLDLGWVEPSKREAQWKRFGRTYKS